MPQDDDCLEIDETGAKGLALRKSRRLDIHRWSDHPEVNAFVDMIFDTFFAGWKSDVRKRHVKVLLLDMYVAWCEDPDLKIAYPRGSNAYKAKSIYNELYISRLTIDVADRLVDVGLASQEKGFRNRNTGIGFISRIWPTDDLVELFKDARFSLFDISFREDRFPIVLRDMDKNEVEFTPLEHGFIEEIDLLNRYNALLRRTFIAIPDAETAAIDQHEQDARHLIASQAEKYVYRVFNRSSFQLGGRYHGPWWTNCPKHLRDKILINDHITIEIDYSSLHPTILYAEAGIDYWKEIGDDPYQLPGAALHEDPHELRNLAKQLLLILINAETIEKVAPALRHQAPKGHWTKHLTNDQVLSAVDALKNLHLPIAKNFHSDVGLRLQNIDSQISTVILRQFLEWEEPILMIHDSYIVRQGFEGLLESMMESAFKQVIGQDFAAKKKYAGMLAEDIEQELSYNYNLRYGQRGTEGEEARDLELYRQINPARSQYYKRSLELFRNWINKPG
ncbi:hypothetical protein [Marimonas arenosa]|uniref:Uncharacterized protein n=1 Tax=Marimonas arenosa TaxID=1795305 RepID=A0AAE3WA82_9RHOB|nr:hypothetical protein [Marimonas arenosa]MDQ2089291.1 hypothetical protein [Marimonas arenosa]